MWTAENRPRYNRDKLRYPSDLTNEEWALVEPFIPPGKRGGGKRTVVMRERGRWGDVHSEHGLPVAQRSQKTFRHAARCSTTSISGVGTARWSASITRST